MQKDSIKLTEEQPSVCLIIIHHKGLDMLKKCLESLFNTNYQNFQVILVDNGSNDGSYEYVTRYYGGKVNVIRSEVNLGFVAGSNLALKKVRANYIVLLNDDVIVDSNWLAELVYEAEKDSSIGACQPKLRSLKDPRFFEYNGACGGMLDIYGVPLTRGRVFDVAEEDYGQYDKPVEIFWASGAALFLREKVIREVGPLDESFYAHMEEIDLCWRIRLAGYKVISVPRSIIYHLGDGTLLPEKFYLKHRNNLIVIIKNYGRWNLLRFLPLRIVQDFFSLIYYLIKGERARSMPVLKAYFWLLKNLRSVLLSRYIVQRRRKVKDKDIINSMVRKSVAVQYYLLRRRYFSQISGLPLELRYYITRW
jgi:GT2 family glycosyltransferase